MAVYISKKKAFRKFETHKRNREKKQVRILPTSKVSLSYVDVVFHKYLKIFSFSLSNTNVSPCYKHLAIYEFSRSFGSSMCKPFIHEKIKKKLREWSYCWGTSNVTPAAPSINNFWFRLCSCMKTSCVKSDRLTKCNARFIISARFSFSPPKSSFFSFSLMKKKDFLKIFHLDGLFFFLFFEFYNYMLIKITLFCV